MDMIKINDIVMKSSPVELYTLVFLSIITVCLFIFIVSSLFQFILNILKKYNITADLNDTSSSGLFKSFILIFLAVLIISLLITISYLFAKNIVREKKDSLSNKMKSGKKKN